MKKDKFETYFWSIIDRYLIESLHEWQIQQIKTMVKKAIKKGKSLKELTDGKIIKN